MPPLPARRASADKLVLDQAAHAGLLLDRFLRAQDSPSDRRQLLAAACRAAAKALDVYQAAFRRREEVLRRAGAACAIFEAEGLLAVGLGNASPLEIGLTLNHIFGVPIIPGSALKGVAATFCATAWGAADAAYRRAGRQHGGAATGSPEEGTHYLTMFGDETVAGHLQFHDAWVLPDCLPDCLTLDVITNHHPGYYQRSGQHAPTDFDSPDPHPFLSVRGRFLVAVSAEGQAPEAGRWAARGLSALAGALSTFGVGAKGGAGYGRLVCLPDSGRVTTSGARQRR